MPKDRDENGEAESRRILGRMASEAEAGGMSFVSRAAKGTMDRIAAKDADPSDPIEYWGTRVGRMLGLALAVALMVWLVIYVTRNG